MKTQTTSTVTINRPKEEVYNSVVNMENYKLWFPEVIDIKSDNSLEHDTVRKKYSEIVKVPFKGEEKISVKIVQAEKSNIFITEADLFPLLPRMIVQFSEDANQNTFLSWSM